MDTLQQQLTDDEIIDAAEKRAENYNDDDRQDIKTDVMNAFYAGVEFARSRTVTTAPAAVLDQLRSRIKEMQEAAYTFGDYSKEAVSVALDGVLEAIDELPVAE